MFDLRAVAKELMAEHAASSKGHWQKVLYRHNHASVALFVFQSGSGIAQHKAAGTVTIHVIDGRMRIKTLGTDAAEYLLCANQMVALAPDVPHAVEALEPSIMLLQICLDVPAR